MKKSTLFILLIAFVFAGLSSSAQQSMQSKIKLVFERQQHHQIESIENVKASAELLQLKGLGSQPGNSENYYWDQVSSWIHQSNTAYTYSATGKLIESIDTDPVANMNISRTTYSYDMHGNQTESASYYWNGTDWELSYGYKNLYTYNSNNQVTEQISQSWDYMTSSYVNNYRDETTYDNDGNITEEVSQYWENDAWVNDYKTTFTNDNNGIPTEVTDYYWDGVEWIPEYRYTDVVWHDYENYQVSSYVTQTYYGGEWHDYERTTYTYNGDDWVEVIEMWADTEWVNYERNSFSNSGTETVWLYEYWDNETGEWVPEYRDTETYDQHGNWTGYTYEYWDTETEEWVMEWGSQQEITYDADNNITEVIYKNWDYYTESYVNSARYVYSNHQDVSGVNDHNRLTNVQIYPNPVSQGVNIRIDDLDVESYNVEILSVTGQIVLANTYSSLSTSININNLDIGIYIMRITADNGKVHSFKLFKE